MNRFSYIANYRKPSALVFLANVWCHWNAAQVKECGTTMMAKHIMMEEAMKYGRDHYHANEFDSWVIEEHPTGGMNVDAKAYYKS